MPDSAIPADRAAVDRIVDGKAVLLVGPDARELVVDADALPSGARECTWVIVDESGAQPRVVGVDQELGEQRRRDLESRMDRLRRERGGGRFGGSLVRWRPGDGNAYERFQQAVELPMLVLALLFLPVLRCLP